MTEVEDCRNAVIYFTRCPICGKVFASFSKYQLLQNIHQHAKKHRNTQQPLNYDVKHGAIDICEE